MHSTSRARPSRDRLRSVRAAGVTLATSALAAALVLAGRATAATAPAPTFGGEVVGAWYS